MGKIFYVMGPSASGKDTVYQEVLGREELGLRSLVLYTTRPIRANETEGVEYHFVDEERLAQLESEGRVIELREYHTVQGIWKYFTVDDEELDLEKGDYLAIGTLVSYGKLREYFGEERMEPVYIEVSEDVRIERALKRERKQAAPDYQEMCRRFLADSVDFSEEKLEKAGIGKRFRNDGEKEECIEEIVGYILEQKDFIR
ncbi:MAG: guanylate kinase [Eubacteriales bacterium]|nr:guanylate kinase [Eubacteriales bacterium]